MANPSTDVLIVGAGPTGLCMAIELKRFGVPFRLIDKSALPAQHSQALVVQARTLEQFERYGIAAAAVERGTPLRHASILSEGRTVVSFPFDRIPGRYPFILFLPQNETEALLIAHLESLGVRVERGIELVSIADQGDKVDVQLRCADGQVEDTSAPWVVGCDGAHSKVREQLGIPFSGSKADLNFFLGDLELEGPDLPGDELRVYLHRGNVVLLGRLKENLFRVIVALHSEQGDAEHEGELTLSDFQRSIDDARIQLRAVSANWMTVFRVSDRRAEKMHKNRVFLAGDASHIHSPVGGQGMNTGIQDVANLAWKIAAVRNGASLDLLKSYELERGQVSEQLLQKTSRALKVATTSNLWIEKVRDAILLTATQIPFIQEQIVGFISEMAIAYNDSPIVMERGGGGVLSAGDRMPNPEIVWRGRRMHLLDPLQKARHLVVGFDVKNSRQVKERFPQAEGLFLNSVELGEGKEEITALLGDEGGIAIVRPDGYIGFHGKATDLESLDRYALMTGLGLGTGVQGAGAVGTGPSLVA